MGAVGINIFLNIQTRYPLQVLACLLAELVTGEPLFEGEDEIEVSAAMVQRLGPPPQHLKQRWDSLMQAAAIEAALAAGVKVSDFFITNGRMRSEPLEPVMASRESMLTYR